MMKNLKRVVPAILCLFMLLQAGLYAQVPDTTDNKVLPVPVTRSNNKIVLEGKIYYIHVVKKGQTLYSIARAYNVSDKEILIENPGASAKLDIGQKLIIPSVPGKGFEINTGKELSTGRVHVMHEGETIFSVSRAYKCSVEEILQLNPELEIDDIPIGTRIKLPAAEENKNEQSFDEEGYIFHKVKRGETLYSLAKYYEVSVKEIRLANKELGWGGPRAGDVIRIPKPMTTVEVIFEQDSGFFQQEEVLIDSLELEESYDYPELESEWDRPRKVVRVAYLIPFQYEEMEPLDSILKKYKSASYRQRVKEDYLAEQSKPKSVGMLEFMEGSLMALDSLSDDGMRLDIQVYDTKHSMYTTRRILENPGMKDLDLIIGPFFPENIEVVSEFSEKNRIPMVTPFLSVDSLLKRNPYFFQAVPSPFTEFKHSAEYISRVYDSNLIFIHDGDSAKLEEVQHYKTLLFDELKKYSAEESVLFKEVIIQDAADNDLILALNPDMKNLIIMPSNDEAFASMVASKLFYELDKYDIEVFGSSYWLGFDDIDISYIHALKLRVSHSIIYDYDDPKFMGFLKAFRQNFYKEPSVYSRQGFAFAITGYDLSTYFLSGLKQYGKRFIVHLDDMQVDRTIKQYSFERVSRAGGYENNKLDYYCFADSLLIRKVEAPQRPPVHHFMKPAGDDPFYFWSKPAVDTTLRKEEEEQE